LVLEAGLALQLEPTDPLIAICATDAVLPAQLGNIGARRCSRQDELASEVHRSVFLPGHFLALHLSPMSCPLDVTDVLYQTKVCPHPNPLPRTGEGTRTCAPELSSGQGPDAKNARLRTIECPD